MNKYLLLLLLGMSRLAAQPVVVHFSVDMRPAGDITAPGLRGSLAPLSWERTWPLQPTGEPGIYEAIVRFDTGQTLLDYKFVHGETVWELDGDDNRRLRIGGTPPPRAIWNQAVYPDTLRIVPAAQLLREYEIVREAYLTLHPGLYRYNDSASLAALFERLRTDLSSDQDLGQVYLAYTRFTAGLRCGHTFANFWNQGDEVRHQLFYRIATVPFAFRLAGDQMVCTAAIDARLKGAAIEALDGRPVPDIIAALLPYVKADGSNDGCRRYALQVDGSYPYTHFDVLYVRCFGPGDSILVQGRDRNGQPFALRTPTTDPRSRNQILQARYGLPDSYDDTWQFRLLDDSTAYLRLGAFDTFNMTLDWEAFLRDVFRQLRRQRIDHLVLDIRGNEGGADDVVARLASYLVGTPTTVPGWDTRLRYDRAPTHLRPYLGTWDTAFYDRRADLLPVGDGYFAPRVDSDTLLRLPVGRRVFRGKTYLLIDEANSSATFLMARTVRDAGLATLVGSPTGGSLRGINGGSLFFLRLPYSGVELDIPLNGLFARSPQPDTGVQPDIYAPSTPQDLARGVDTALEAARAHIRRQR